MRLATENVLAEFLREVKCIAEVQEKQGEIDRQRREERTLRKQRSQQTVAITDADTDHGTEDGTEYGGTEGNDEENDWEGEGSGAWQPGQGVYVDHAAIMDIVIQHLSYPGEWDPGGDAHA